MSKLETKMLGGFRTIRYSWLFRLTSVFTIVGLSETPATNYASPFVWFFFLKEYKVIVYPDWLHFRWSILCHKKHETDGSTINYLLIAHGMIFMASEPVLFFALSTNSKDLYEIQFVWTNCITHDSKSVSIFHCLLKYNLRCFRCNSSTRLLVTLNMNERQQTQTGLV